MHLCICSLWYVNLIINDKVGLSAIFHKIRSWHSQSNIVTKLSLSTFNYKYPFVSYTTYNTIVLHVIYIFKEDFIYHHLDSNVYMKCTKY